MNGYVPSPMQYQLPNCVCTINGKCLGGVSCTAYGMANAATDSTRGRIRPNGCSLRRTTGDTVGGLTIRQIAPALDDLGIDLQIHVGSGVVSPAYLARRLWANRPAVAQGNTGALIGGPAQSTTGAVNHLIALAGVRGGTTDVPKDVLVLDSAADGRRPGIATSPQWWSWALFLKFCAALRPYGDFDTRVLGPGKIYCAIYPATPGPVDTASYRFHIEDDTTLRVYKLKAAKPVYCIESMSDMPWENASSAPCTKPVWRPTCDGKSGAVTVKVLGGKLLVGKYLRVGRGTRVTKIGA